MAKHLDGPPGNSDVRKHVEQLLHGTRSFQQLDGATRQALSDALSQITEYLNNSSAGLPVSHPLATQLAPLDLQRRLAPQDGRPIPNQPALSPDRPTAGGPPSSGSPTSIGGRVGEATRATLGAIDFPSFVGSLIQGTFQAIVDASIQQMEAYAELLKNVARTVDQFMTDNVSDATARDYLADQHEDFLVRDTSSGQPRLRVNEARKADAEMPSFFKDLGFESPEEIDDQAVEEKIVPAARRSLAEQRQQTLATMVLMGINRVVVDDGELLAKLMFHIDASETTNLRFDQSKTTSGNMSGRAGRNPFTANAIMVNTTSLNAQSDLNVRADLTGQVKVRFRSETFPLERFADSAAIQLINQNAKVAQPLPVAGNVAPAPAATSPAGADVTVAPPSSPPRVATAKLPAPATQSLGADYDPWSPTTVGENGLE
jgi:hypothetical protein